MIKESINLLGRRAIDRVTKFKGTVTSVCFDLFGCVQIALTPPANTKGELPDGRWFDVNRLTVFARDIEAMPVPDFDAKAREPADYGHGAAEKPAMAR